MGVSLDWRPVHGWPYEVSGHGEVRRGSRVLRPQRQTNGCLYVVLCRAGERRNHRIHRLVADAFLGDSGAEVNHRDGDKTNNRADNLEWVLHSDNQAHASQNGLMARGEDHGMAKLTPGDVRGIRAMRSGGAFYREIARAHGVSDSTVRRVVSGETWGHVL